MPIGLGGWTSINLSMVLKIGCTAEDVRYVRSYSASTEYIISSKSIMIYSCYVVVYMLSKFLVISKIVLFLEQLS